MPQGEAVVSSFSLISGFAVIDSTPDRFPAANFFGPLLWAYCAANTSKLFIFKDFQEHPSSWSW
jgi:hypothetical protein